MPPRLGVGLSPVLISGLPQGVDIKAFLALGFGVFPGLDFGLETPGLGIGVTLGLSFGVA